MIEKNKVVLKRSTKDRDWSKEKMKLGKISDPEIKEDKISPVGLSQNPSGEKEERQLWDGCQSQQTDT